MSDCQTFVEIVDPQPNTSEANDIEIPSIISMPVRIANFLTIVLPFLSLIVAAVFLWGNDFNWLYLGLMLGMYFLTAMGITVGFHRLYTHRAFEAARPVKLILGVLGSMSVEGPLLRWVAVHRLHHQHSDQEEDPHSPHTQGDGIVGFFRGLFHSHMGWLFRGDARNLMRYAGDLAQDPLASFVSRYFAVWVAIGLLIPTVLGGVLTGTWMGAWLGFIWGGLVRVFFVHHVTWSVNSVCHIWGSRPFRSEDHSRNNFVFGVLACGEGWHNNHHAFPTSARHGLRWWEIDVSYLVIRTLAAMKLAWKVRIPSETSKAAKKRADKARLPLLVEGLQVANWGEPSAPTAM